MACSTLLRRFLKAESGATLIEFAVVSVAFFTLMCGIIEYGLIMMTKIAIESATEQVARTSSINSTGGTGCATRACVIQTLIAQDTLGIVNPANVLITSRVINSPTDSPPAMPDVCTDHATDPYPPTCTSWQENNGVDKYQQNNIDAGATDQLVQISVFYKWKVMFPIMQPFFTGGVVNMTATTVVKDEPFGL